MIRKFGAKNFRCLKNVDLNLEPLTLLLGPNASGKTSILDALHVLCEVGGTRARSVFQGDRDISDTYSRGGKGALELKCDGVWDNVKGSLKLSCAEPKDGVEVWSYRLTGKWGREPFTYSSDAKNDQPLKAHKKAGTLGDEIRRVAFLRFEPRRLAAPVIDDKAEAPQLGSDGDGLALALSQMMLTNPDDFHRLEDALRSVIPSVRRVRFERTTVTHQKAVVGRDGHGEPDVHYEPQRRPAQRLVFDMEAADDVPAHAASEGTLLVLGLLAVLMSPDQPRLVLIDDFDRGLHAAAMKSVVSSVRALLAHHPELQVIATAHSPYLVDYLEPEEVRLTALGPDGATRCKALTDHPEFAQWQETMRPGEFWSTVGEQWVLAAEARPKRKR